MHPIGCSRYHYKARVYDPKIGRFLQSDRIGYTDDMNLYAYTRNDPIGYGDPTGEDRFKLLVGDPGLRRYNTGGNFMRAAETRAQTLRSQGHDVDVVRISSVGDFNKAITTGPKIDGGIEYFGHGFKGGIAPGERSGANTNITASNIYKLSGDNLASDITIKLNSCYGAVGGSESIAQLMADELGVTVIGSMKGLGFTDVEDKYLHGEGVRPPESGPLYMTPPQLSAWRSFDTWR